ncbi:MAG: tRNA uridine-5-carboxymethylaminomethyl(34) synthesis GTPase MnmE [Candidatus Omnitrophica bacterium]|nr:tRNA uridine-5-carboxymethylaminomethyl(34) synthesis GTPase MnmE [Candidatus Omnitrophota bacterium]
MRVRDIAGSNDTIVALSTPPGENGIGIVRLSGPSTLEIVDKVFLPRNGARLSEFKSHTIHYGHIADNGRVIDEVLLMVMRAPKTYTREDIVEVNCHGGVVAVKEILDLFVCAGARIAEPGEFTKRAFMSGRIDLAQAEAVLDIITSRTSDGLKMAQRQLNGETSRMLKKIRSGLLDIIAEIEAFINFPDEDLDIDKTSSFEAALEGIKRDLSGIIDSSDKGLILREGITTVICGKPNVGKSSLMNSFLRQKRAIVTPVPGTTRDTIEEVINVDGIPLKIVDTAGIMHAEDELTRESVDRSRHYMQGADLILLVLDSSDKLNQQDLDIIDMVKDKKTLVVINKTDLPEVLQIDKIKSHLHDRKIIRVSAKEGMGLDDLKKAIYDIFWSGEVTAENILLSNSRHIEAARRAFEFVEKARRAAAERTPWEILAVDIKDGAQALGTITGEVFDEDLLDTIFSRFCIGK